MSTKNICEKCQQENPGDPATKATHLPQCPARTGPTKGGRVMSSEDTRPTNATAAMRDDVQCLLMAIDHFVEVLNAVTVPHDDGARCVDGIMQARMLSDATHKLYMAMRVLILNLPFIKLEPPAVAAIFSAARAVGWTPDELNQAHERSPDRPPARWRTNDIISKNDVARIESASNLLRLSSPIAAKQLDEDLTLAVDTLRDISHVTGR